MSNVMCFCVYAPSCVNNKTCQHAFVHFFNEKICDMRNCSDYSNDKNKIMAVCTKYDKRIFCVDDRVVFINNHSGYNIGPDNPLFGSPFFCIGTVTEVKSPYNVSVVWDNGFRNGYKHTDLEYLYQNQHLVNGFVKKFDPNRMFASIKRLGRR